MNHSMRTLGLWMATGLVASASSVASAAVLTADQAVQIALKNSTAAINAEAGVIDARGGLYGAYSGVLPQLSASVTRSNSTSEGLPSPVRFGSTVFPTQVTTDQESHGTIPGINGSWSVLNLSSLGNLASAGASLRAARQRQSSSRNEIAFSTRRQFYEVVKAIRLADVASGALRLARDEERRVHALFEVGSVSKNDLLKAQVRTAQSELDSLTSSQTLTIQRILLATEIGVAESALGEVDTILVAQPHDYDEGALVSEAANHRPDLMAAESEVRAAGALKWAARLQRMPYVTVGGRYDFKSTSRSTSTQTLSGPALPSPYDTFVRNGVSGSTTTTGRVASAQLSLNWDLIDGFAADARNAAATARLQRANAARDALKRNLASDIHQALNAYRAAVVGAAVAQRAAESAEESVKLTQQKYNVGSSTILELIDSQVQLQRTQSDQVSAAAAIRVAEARLDMVRGKQE